MRKTVRIALFASLAAALGFLLAGVPNIELLTFCLFTSGYIQGLRAGIATGLLATLIYYGLNPYGSSLMFPPLFLSQLTAGVVISALGALFALLTRFLNRETRSAIWGRRILLIPFAATSALMLTILPTISFALFSGGEWRGWLFLGGLMTAWGFLFNMIVFLTSFEPLIRQTRRLAFGVRGGSAC
ncbi:MAG: hypothetical protein GY835_21180 [bacterium]|nr:hypothetical protein [bacterium]